MRWISLLVLISGCNCGGISDPARQVLELLDIDGSGDLSVEEMANPDSIRLHRELDTDGDGTVSLEELRFDLGTTGVYMPLVKASAGSKPFGSGPAPTEMWPWSQCTQNPPCEPSGNA